MSKQINWGILGPGKIAHKFVSDLLLVDGAVLRGVASRDLGRSEAFGEEYGAVKSYGSYEDMMEDPEIDIVYVSTPHVFHFENTMLCLNAGKSVLCEKPMGVNAQQVQQMIRTAQAKNLFLMEAIWTRFIPSTVKVLELIEQGHIGSIEHIRADFGFKANTSGKTRLFERALGGGSLLDIGIYPVYISLLLLGAPDIIEATATMTEEEVDLFCGMLFGYKGGQRAVLESTLASTTPSEAIIYGTKGGIKMHRHFHFSPEVSLLNTDGEVVESFKLPHQGNGYYHEIVEVMDCLKNNQTESTKVSHALSDQLIQTLDKVRKKIGLTYPADEG